MTITLADEQEAIPLDRERFLREVEEAARGAGYRGDLSVAVVTDDAIRALNRRFLGRDRPTDVLAFPLDEAEGEVVVSADRAVREAERRGVPPLAELMLYVVHGILHLSGYDDREPAAARRMHAETLRILRRLGHRNRIEAPRGRGD